MDIRFRVGDRNVEFRRNWINGRAELLAGGGSILLQDPRSIGTHFTTAMVRTWRHEVDGHEVVVEQKRKRFLAGFRRMAYSVTVDGLLVTEKVGR